MKLSTSIVVRAICCAALATATCALATELSDTSAKRAWRAHVSFLADDLLEGRETGTRGYDLAALYVSSQFKSIGLKPAGSVDDPTAYHQRVSLRSTSLIPGSAFLEIQTKEGTEALPADEGFFAHPSFTVTDARAAGEAVYVGYGIVSPRFRIDDYDGKKVAGKIAVMLMGAPSDLPSEESAHFANVDLKRDEAARRGAVGVLLLQTAANEAAFNFAVAAAASRTSRMTWVNDKQRDIAKQPEGQHFQQTAFLSLRESQRLTQRAGETLESLIARANTRAAPPTLDFGARVRMGSNSRHENLTSWNVVGILEGSDPMLKHEYIVASAHLDHLGIAKGKSGDTIHNGAMDNATGVATLLEAARAVAAMPVKPKRSILFVALTAEEKGFAGSSYFVEHPPVQKSMMVANVNLDQALLLFDFQDVVAYGMEHSTLCNAVTAAAAKNDIGITPDPQKHRRIFTRSDQYSFVKAGIPAVYLTVGVKSRDAREDVAKIREHFLANHYHRVSDDLKLPIQYDAAVRFTQLVTSIVLEAANASVRPSWKPGNFFADTFGK